MSKILDLDNIIAFIHSIESFILIKSITNPLIVLILDIYLFYYSYDLHEANENDELKLILSGNMKKITNVLSLKEL